MRVEIKASRTKLKAYVKAILANQIVQIVADSQSPIRLTDFGSKISATGSENDWEHATAPSIEAGAAGKAGIEFSDLCLPYVERCSGRDAGFKRTV